MNKKDQPHSGSKAKKRKERSSRFVVAGHRLTRDSGLEGTARDVVGTSIFDANQVVSRRHGGVLHLVALWNLLAVHLYFRRTLDGDGQGPGASFSVVDDEL